jgi:hypothetical protein
MEAIYGIVTLVLMFVVISALATVVLFVNMHPQVFILARVGRNVLEDNSTM